MRGAIVACVLAIAVVTACLVNKRSNDFECSPGDDCGTGRACEDGFCVAIPIDAPPDAPQCPSVGSGLRCTTCDLVLQTCNVDCSTATCNSLTCPPGFACTFDCTKANACDGIDCRDGASCVVRCDGNSACNTIQCAAGGCDITCSSSNACDNITCGPGPCDVNCAVTNACNKIDCGTSCNCDVTCAAGTCDEMTCPMPGGIICTDDGMATGQCSSTPAGCALCADF